ncbi:MAG: TonB-dependent receptor [Melioribacteraceae bacterium]|nr:TonB-dependent receptor [Melioribacteraceae bacterium]
MRKKNQLYVSILLILLTSFQLIANSNSFRGKIIDKVSRETLPGASIFIKNTNIGVISNLNGDFQFNNLKDGTYFFTVRYLGYNDKEVKIELSNNKTINQTIEIEQNFIEGEEVVVSAQAEAQKSAINQQLNSLSIKNIVSAKKIQEVPDANAAEAIGRLPGISLVRNGGEGSKVIIRGLSPKYNSIQVEGVKLASSGAEDRSTDLSMVSPFILEGIEVTKAQLPDKEADAMGGSVNFILKEASNKDKFEIITQTGFNGLQNKLGDYKFVLSGSKRFFENKLGVLALVDLERRNRSSDEYNVNYTNLTSPEKREEVDISIGNLYLLKANRILNRFGASLVVDYKFENSKIKFTNFVGQNDNKNEKRINNLRPFLADVFYSMEDRNNKLLTLTNSLRYEHNIDNLHFDLGVFYSFSENSSPQEVIFQGYEPNAFDTKTIKYQIHPEKLSTYLVNNLDDAYLYDISNEKNYSKERQLSFEFNIKYSLDLSDDIIIKLKTGIMLKNQYKVYNKDVRWMPISWGGGVPSNSIKMILQNYPWMQVKTPIGASRIPWAYFLEDPSNKQSFLDNKYSLKNVPKLNMVREINTLLSKELLTSYHRSIKDDYNGNENYYAGYIMSEINLGTLINLIPGFRFENNKTEYLGIRGNDQTLLEHIGYSHKDTLTNRNESFLLPMIHLRIKPANWFDIRLAYTQSLSRPNYNHIIPSWNIGLNMVTWNNPNLKTSLSKNFDLYTSFYTNELGLLTVGGFYKEIKDLIFWSGIRAIIDPNLYGLTKNESGKTISTMVNNPYTAFVSGIELEWQTNFWFLPGLLKGIVLNTNYTRVFSTARYPRTEIKTTYLMQPPWVKTVNIDTFYVARLIDQPNDIFNITVGYDYKDLSLRLSYLYQDDIFKRDNFYEKLRGNSIAYKRLDFTVKQKLPIEGLDLFFNYNNILNAVETDVVNGNGYPSREQYYLYTIDLGIRYKFN